MGAGALADKLSISKAVLVIPALLSPQSQFDYGAGSHLLATVPQFQSLLPRSMVSILLRNVHVRQSHDWITIAPISTAHPTLMRACFLGAW